MPVFSSGIRDDVAAGSHEQQSYAHIFNHHFLRITRGRHERPYKIRWGAMKVGSSPGSLCSNKVAISVSADHWQLVHFRLCSHFTFDVNSRWHSVRKVTVKVSRITWSSATCSQCCHALFGKKGNPVNALDSRAPWQGLILHTSKFCSAPDRLLDAHAAVVCAASLSMHHEPIKRVCVQE